MILWFILPLAITLLALGLYAVWSGNSYDNWGTCNRRDNPFRFWSSALIYLLLGCGTTIGPLGALLGYW